MQKLIDRLIKYAVIAIFICVAISFIGSKFVDINKPADTAAEVTVGQQPDAVAQDPIKGALESVKDLTAVQTGFAPKPSGDADLKQALADADIQKLAQAVAAELSRQNYVATEIKRNPAIVAQALVLWGKEQQGGFAPEIKDGEVDPILVGKVLDESQGVVLGNHDAPFMVVEFLDPNCPHCRLAIPELLAWIDREPGAKVLFREFPVIAPQSADAAKVALALGAQGLYRQWLEAIAAWKGGVIDGATARTIAQGLGADMTRLETTAISADTAKAIAASLELGAALQIDGTPATVIGRKLVVGSASADWLADFAAQQGGPMPAKAPAETPAEASTAAPGNDHETGEANAPAADQEEPAPDADK